MPRQSRSPYDRTEEAVLSGAFVRLRPRLLAMIDRRVGRKLALRIDPEGIVQDAYLRALPRWQTLAEQPASLDAWIYRQVVDRLVEVIRSSSWPRAQRRSRTLVVPWIVRSLK